MELSAGQNITITKDPNSGALIISAPTLNEMSMKSGEFKISGEVIEIEAGRGIVISTAMPNKLRISIDINKQIVDMENLKKRLDNLEKVILARITEQKL